MNRDLQWSWKGAFSYEQCTPPVLSQLPYNGPLRFAVCHERGNPGGPTCGNAILGSLVIDSESRLHVLASSRHARDIQAPTPSNRAYFCRLLLEFLFSELEAIDHPRHNTRLRHYAHHICNLYSCSGLKCARTTSRASPPQAIMGVPRSAGP